MRPVFEAVRRPVVGRARVVRRASSYAVPTLGRVAPSPDKGRVTRTATVRVPPSNAGCGIPSSGLPRNLLVTKRPYAPPVPLLRQVKRTSSQIC